jgi:uncharacterized phage-associated protein
MKVFDVAEYILHKLGLITTMKLQKLVYYCQAWSLVWDDKPLFDENIEAWANGPVVKELYEAHRGKYTIGPGELDGKLDNISSEEKETIDAVLEFYGDKSSQWLIDLTHMEDPWRQARQGLEDTERSNHIISPASMAEYYSSL